MPPKNKSKKYLAAQRKREEERARKQGPEALAAYLAKQQAGTKKANGKKDVNDVASNVTSKSAKSDTGELPTDTSTTANGILQSIYGARDIKIGAFSLNFHNKVLVEDTLIELTVGRRYGLIGANGCGKSTFLRVLAERQVPIPEYIDIHLLSEEAQPTEESALEYVINSAKREVARLEDQADAILVEEGPESLVLQDVYDKLDELDPSTFESRASTILCGLGFTNETIGKKTKDMSGGWRMRVALAKALFIQPSMLLLDEPTNHVSFRAVDWPILRGLCKCFASLLTYIPFFLHVFLYFVNSLIFPLASGWRSICLDTTKSSLWFHTRKIS